MRPRPCWCSGYWFPHRKGSGACEHSPYFDFYKVLRCGGKLHEAMQELTPEQLARKFPSSQGK